ncbi:Glycosyltransferase, catalytic subunit of cellulose synthase and poly-beta-1,6-N-acetylglucosamine synthase [Flavobacteriaceae bacterium MAR_2010_188]|nr:Glycosyltransferase, catalytic subunit of cellulose synthase and poly-beta-1,6-N-acetylglucosamine synthase [Flavobacteriaceae bacterium MAR_2010_188]
MNYSFIIPVYNRPEEIKELLQSFTQLQFSSPYEIVIIEDGSTIPCASVIAEYENRLDINYLTKQNSGPGDSRNFGMREAVGDYYIILDSDCLLPPRYLDIVDQSLKSDFVDCYGGPDAAHSNFNNLQKSINFAMTSVLSTGGIRGGKKNIKDFQPRSFNMGISRKAFSITSGFRNIHPGEDPDLAIRIKEAGLRTKLISEAFVYHKRRISWKKFYQQVNKFGLVRPILNKWHPDSSKFTFWFPTLFLLGTIGAIVLLLMGIFWPIILVGLYLLLIFLTAVIAEKNLIIAVQSVIAVLVQLMGYGWGYLKSFFYVSILNRNPEKQFPKLFFKNGK